MGQGLGPERPCERGSETEGWFRREVSRVPKGTGEDQIKGTNKKINKVYTKLNCITCLKFS